jgi:hypothetical protein
MSMLRSLLDGLRSLFRRERVDGELDEDLRGFLNYGSGRKDKEEGGDEPARISCANAALLRTTTSFMSAIVSSLTPSGSAC